MSALDQCTAYLGEPNCQAFLRVIREGESHQGEDAYTLINGGGHFTAPPWRHPWLGISTNDGAKACGAYQELGTTAAGCDRALGLNGDFSPLSQDLHAVYLIVEQRAMESVLRGDIVTAMEKLSNTWIAFRGLGQERARRVFVNYGGTPSDAPAPAAQAAPGATQPAPEVSAPPQRSTAPQGGFMPLPAILGILSVLGPVIQGVLPVLEPLIGGKKDHAAMEALSTALNVVVEKTQGPGVPVTMGSVANAVEAMQNDPAVKKDVTDAVVTHPGIQPLLEIGGGIKAAREADLVAMQSERPFWYSPVMWMTVLLLPLVYYTVIMVLGGFANVTDETKAMVVGFVIGTVLGSMVAYFYGTTKQSGDKDAVIAKVATSP